MAGLQYVGKLPQTAQSIDTKLESETEFDTGITRSYVDGRAITLAGPYGTKTYVDTQDGQFTSVSYYQAQDNLNVSSSSVGVVNGVASLDSGSKIPSSQVPVLGVGTLLGPYGTTSTATGTATTTPLQIAAWNIGATGVNFKPMAFMSAIVQAVSFGRPVIEIRAGDNTQTTYASQTLVAQGFGRALYNDFQPVTVLPAPDTTNVMQDGTQTYYGPNVNFQLTAWLYEATGVGSCVLATNNIYAASAWLLRVHA